MTQPFNKCNRLYENLKSAVENATKRIQTLYTVVDQGDTELYEILQESIIQTHEVATELAWKTVRCYALQEEPEGRVSGSTTAIKHGLSTGIIQSEDLSRTLLECVYYRNKSSHEYLLINGMEEYISKILQDFNPALNELVKHLEAW